ncbi:MAG TPA: hypothetical protein VKB69_14190, partial [Micromonosporaceae bacterium]|nr:hypothetical protein [Micromonosporaceae bacterium]
MAVDVTNTPGTEIVFRLSKTTPSPPLSTHVVVVPSVGSTPVTVKVPVTLAHQWQVLEKMPTTFSYFNQCSDAGHTLPYQTNAWYLADQVTDDLLYPPLKFTAGELLQQPVTSPVISRELPQYIPGNSVDILVDGQRIKASVLQAIRAAQHHIHLNWFFFDTKSEISVALQVACERGVEVRLLFDWVATAMPEPIGQGIAPGSFLEGMRDLKNAGVQVGRSSLLVAPLDNIRDVSDPEYRDRLNIQKEYAKALMLTHGGMAGYTTLRKLGPPVVTLGLPVRIKQAYDNVGALGQAGIGTPVLLGGCRDHTKLIIVDGK